MARKKAGKPRKPTPGGKVSAITPIEYDGWQEAYDYFNRALFDDMLDDVVIVHQNKANMRGSFAFQRYDRRDGRGKQHRIALNTDVFVGMSDEVICSILVHEMVHCWQHQYGKPSRGYHNKQWAEAMKRIGLQPSSTGAPGGNETGARVSHYVVDGGLFQTAFQQLAARGWRVKLQSSAHVVDHKAPVSKVKFTCPECGQNVWGRPDTHVGCLDCDGAPTMRGLAS
jgi:hypothetical protein